MNPETVILSEVRKGNTNIVYKRTYVESEKISIDDLIYKAETEKQT